jgi:hypothetical protein
MHQGIQQLVDPSQVGIGGQVGSGSNPIKKNINQQVIT